MKHKFNFQKQKRNFSNTGPILFYTHFTFLRFPSLLFLFLSILFFCSFSQTVPADACDHRRCAPYTSLRPRPSSAPASIRRRTVPDSERQTPVPTRSRRPNPTDSARPSHHGLGCMPGCLGCMPGCLGCMPGCLGYMPGCLGYISAAQGC